MKKGNRESNNVEKAPPTTVAQSVSKGKGPGLKPFDRNPLQTAVKGMDEAMDQKNNAKAFGVEGQIKAMDRMMKNAPAAEAMRKRTRWAGEQKTGRNPFQKAK